MFSGDEMQKYMYQLKNNDISIAHKPQEIDMFHKRTDLVSDFLKDIDPKYIEIL